MKNKKITRQQVKFIINMISITIFVVAYFYVYNGYIKKTEAAYKEIDLTKQSIEELKIQLSEEDTVRQDMDEVNNQMQTIIDSFPVDIAKEDNLLFIEQMQKVLDINFTSINVTDSTPIYETILPIRNEDGTEVEQAVTNVTITNSTTSNPTSDSINSDDNTSATTDNQTASLEETEGNITKGNITEDSTNSDTTAEQTGTNIATETTTATQQQVMQGTQSSITMNFQATYKEFKKLVDYIANYPDKTVIDSVSVSYDNTTGNLTGSLVLKRFALTGTGKVYEIPMIEDISIGTDNIFGTDTN